MKHSALNAAVEGGKSREETKRQRFMVVAGSRQLAEKSQTAATEIDFQTA